MSHSPTMTPGQCKDLAVALAQFALTTLTFEGAQRLLACKTELKTAVQDAQWRLAGAVSQTHDTPVSKPSAHADIRIPRTIDGEQIIFAGFVEAEDEDGYVLGDEMMERLLRAGLEPIFNSDHLGAHLKDWAGDPRLTPFYIVTNDRLPEGSRHVRYFRRGTRSPSRRHLGHRFDRSGLVACRAV